MENSPINNIQLTPEQIQQLAVVQTRLVNLEAEVNIATESLAQKRQEMAQAVKDTKYQEEILAEATAKATDATTHFDILTASIAEKTTELQNIKETAGRISAKHEAKEQELSTREYTLIEKEVEHARKHGLLSDQIHQLNNDKKEVEEKKQKIQNIIDSI